MASLQQAAVLELIYFDVMARGLAPACALELSGLPWARRASPDRMALKADHTTYPFGQLPVLVHGEVVVAQSTAIANYIGRQARMLGAGELEHTTSDMLIAAFEVIYQLLTDGVPTAYAKLGERRKGDFDFYRKTLDELLPVQLLALERLLAARHGKWSAAENTVGEIYLATLLYQIRLVHASCLDATPLLKSCTERMLARPELQLVISGRSRYGHWVQYFISAEPPLAPK